MGDRKAAAKERSQSVYSANWKEDCLLQRKLKELDSSEKKVIHGIEIDQRVVNKKFQQKLYRSRLAYARMTGNREKLKELLQKDGYRFNTNVSGDDEFTLKLPRASSAPTMRSKRFGNQFPERPATTAISNPHSKTLGVDNLGSRDRRPRSCVSIASRSVAPRPLTAAVPEKTRNGRMLEEEDDLDMTIDETDSDSDDGDEESDDDHNHGQRGRKKSTAKRTRFSVSKMEPRPKTAVGFVTKNSHPIHRPKTTNSITKTKVSGGLFDDEKPPTLLEVHYAKVKAANFPRKVDTFIRSVKYLVTGDAVDYYTLRLVENADRGSKNKLSVDCVESVAEKRDALRSTGDLNARNLTMRTVSMEYEQHDHMLHRIDMDGELSEECNTNDVEMEDFNEQ